MGTVDGPLPSDQWMARLTRQGDMSKEACAIRFIAARMVTGLPARQLAEEAGLQKAMWSHIETGRAWAPRRAMSYLYRRHGIDFNYLLNGDFRQLPHPLLLALLAKLPLAASEWDRKQRLDPAASREPFERQAM